MREGHTLAVQVTLSVVAVVTLRSSYKVRAHMHTLTVVCVVVTGSSEHGLLFASDVCGM